MTFDVAPELSRGCARSRNAQKGFSYNLNASVCSERSNKMRVERASRKRPTAASIVRRAPRGCRVETAWCATER